MLVQPLEHRELFARYRYERKTNRMGLQKSHGAGLPPMPLSVTALRRLVSYTRSLSQIIEVPENPSAGGGRGGRIRSWDIELSETPYNHSHTIYPVPEPLDIASEYIKKTPLDSFVDRRALPYYSGRYRLSGHFSNIYVIHYLAFLTPNLSICKNLQWQVFEQLRQGAEHTQTSTPCEKADFPISPPLPCADPMTEVSLRGQRVKNQICVDD